MANMPRTTRSSGPVDGGGMQGYVDQKNNRQSGGPQQNAKKPSREDLNKLKVGTKRTASPNTHAARDGNPTDRRKSSNGAHRQDQATHFYDTDLSTLDKTSTSGGSTQRRPSNGRQQLQQADEEQVEGASGQVYPEDDENGPEPQSGEGHDEEDLPKDPMQLAQHGQGVVESGLNRTVPGDSYPDTTSGQPSVADLNENRDANIQQRYNTNSLTQLPNRGGGTRVPQFHKQPAGSTQQPPHSGQGNRQPPPALQLPDPESLLGDIHAGFAFSKPAASMNVHPPSNAPPHSGSKHPKDISQRGLQRGPLPAAQPERRQLVRDEPAQHNNRDEQHMQPLAKPTQRKKSHQPPPVHHTEEDEDEEQMSDERHAQSEALQRPQYQEPAVQEPAFEENDTLDYYPPELYRMKFADLAAKPFDSGPNDQCFEFPEGQEDMTLPEKLKFVAGLKERAQVGFFASLEIEQWEEAGDWFLDRFSEISKRFKETRQAKRRAAHEVEAELLQRHNAVFKKQKLTQEALGEMKKTGGRVLQGTPKKTKKTK